MKNFTKTLAIISVSFAAGYLYSEYKAGRDFELDNEYFSFKLKSDNSIAETIDDTISSITNN